MEAIDETVDNLDEKHIWSQFLQTVRDNSCNQATQRRSLIVLGDSLSGKTSLASSLCLTEVKRGNGVEYHCLDVKEDGRHESMKLSIWIADGDPQLSHLLPYALTEKNFADSLAVLVVSMEEPWNIIDSLEHWADILESHVKRLKIVKSDMHEYRESLVRHFHAYVEPDLLFGNEHLLDGASRTGGSKMVVSSSVHGGLGVNSPTVDGAPRIVTVENPLHPSAHSCGLTGVGTINQQGKTRLFNGNVSNNRTGGDSEEEELADTETNEHSSGNVNGSTSLPVGILEKNLGIPIVVVVTKVDFMTVLKQSHNFTDEYFDFIQMHIRQFCLKYGAALVYTSLKEDKNCALLNQYLRHRVFGLPFQHSAYVVEADSVFVPCGWDNQKKIAILHRNLVHISPNQAYNEILPKPSNYFSLRQGSIRHHRGEAEIVAEDEQVLLARLAASMSKQNTGSSSSVMSKGDDSAGRPPSSTQSPRLVSSSGDVAGLYTPPKHPKTTPQPVSTGNMAPGSSDRVLTSFFKSLLTKERTGTTPLNSSLSNMPSEQNSLVTDSAEKE